MAKNYYKSPIIHDIPAISNKIAQILVYNINECIPIFGLINTSCKQLQSQLIETGCIHMQEIPKEVMRGHVPLSIFFNTCILQSTR